MPLKNTVAVERRIDLASLFCMISRHGPAVALAVIAMVSVLAGFIIYRTVRGKRRKATDGDGQSRGEERDAAVIDPCTEEGYSSVESTDVSDEASSDMKEELILSDLKIRHRRIAAAEKKPPPCSPLKSDFHVSDIKHTTSDGTREMAVVWDSYKAAETFAEEACQGLQSDTNKVGEMVVDYEQDATDPDVKDVIEVVHDNESCLREPEPTNYEHELKMVLKAEYDEDQDVSTDKEEDNFLCALNSPVCIEEASVVGEMGDDDRLHNDKTPQELNSVGSNLEEPITDIKDVPFTSLSDNKEEQFEEGVPDMIACHSYSSNNVLIPKKEMKDEKEGAEEESADHPTTAQQAVIWSSTHEETNLPSTQQDHNDHVTDEPTAANGDYDGSAGEVREMLEDDHFHNHTAVKSEDHLPQFDMEEVKFDQKVENGLACNQEVSVLDDGADQVKEKVLASDNSMGCSDEPDSSSVALSCLSIPIKVDDHDDLSDGVTEAKAHILCSTDFSDVSSDCQQPQLENIKALSLEEETNSVSLCPDMPTNESANQPENNGKDTMAEWVEERNDCVYDPDIQPSYEVQQSVTALHDNVFDKASITAGPHAVGSCDIATAASPIIFEEVSNSDMSPSQDQQSDQIENNDILVETRVKSTTDAPVCDYTTTTSPITADEVSHTDILSTSQDQQSELMVHDEKFAETMILSGTEATAFDNVSTTSPITAEEISQTDHLSPSQEQQIDLMENTEKFAATMILSGTETTAFDNATITSPIIGEEISHADMLSASQDQQSDLMENAERFAETMILSDTEATAFDNVTITSSIIGEEICHTDKLTAPESQQSDQMENNKTFTKTRDTSYTDAPTSDNATTTSQITTDEIFHTDLLPPSQDQQSEYSESNEILDKKRVNSATDAPACNDTTTTSLITAEEISPEMMSSPQEQQSEQTENKEYFPEVSTATAPTPTISPPMCQVHFLSFEQSEIRENDTSPSGVDEESGISSMAVSPDLQDAGNVFDVSDEHMVHPVTEHDLQSKGKTEAQNSLFADDVAVSFIDKDSHTGMVFGLQHVPSQLPKRECTDWKTYESFVANEDTFGCEIEDSYHREMSQFMAQIAASVTSFTNEQKIETDMKAVVEAVEMKKTEESAEKKEETKAGKEKEEDFERTEISIMEATMDNNEWITESNYQSPPWLNLSTSSLAQDNTKINQPPTEDRQDGFVVSDTTCIDSTDIPPSPEVNQTSSASLIEDNLENNKKVVAVQPMPQNVNVTFRVHYFTQSPYQTVAVTGDQQELGNWKGFIPLERAKDGHWATVISLPAESHVEWKFVVVDKGEVCRWEECGNRLLDTGYGEDLLVHKWWGHL